MTVRINKQKINLREKLTEFEDKVNFDEVVRGLGVYPSDGNVGIGTASPSVALEVQNGWGNQFRISRSSSPDQYSEITGGGSSMKFSSVNSDSTHSAFSFVSDNGTDELERMRIDASGNVGIGTTNPGAYKLYINGTARVSGGDVTSDDRVKHNEQAIVGAIETLGKLTPKKYIKTTEMYDADHNFELDTDGNPIDEDGKPVEHSVEAGVIAQQVLEVPELAFTVSPEGVDEDGNVTSPHGLNYNSLFTYAIAAIQEQQSIIEDLKSRIETLESK